MFKPQTYAAGQPNDSDTIAWEDPPAPMVAAARAVLEDRAGILFDTDPDRYGPLCFSQADAG